MNGSCLRISKQDASCINRVRGERSSKYELPITHSGRSLKHAANIYEEALLNRFANLVCNNIPQLLTSG